MNKLCISKLLQVIGEEMIPNERASGGTSDSRSSTSSAGASSQPTATLVRNHETRPTPTSPFSQSHQPTPPFKPAQPRF
jgi:hypothetical protein